MNLFRLGQTALVLVLLVSGCTTPSYVPPSSPPVLGHIPPRPRDARGAAQLYKELTKAGEASREAIVLRELSRGNMPNYLRKQAAVRFVGRTRSGQSKTVTLWTLPDYLAIGSDADFVRMPMSPVTAQKLADRFGLMLPTVRMVDAIYKASPLRLAPRPFKAGRGMVTVAEYYRHQTTVQAQLGGKPPKGLLAGHKKDVVLSNLLLARPKKVAIYGWHQLNGRAIQPLSTVHGNWYADYSHGIRLVNVMVKIDQRLWRISDVLKNPELAPLLSSEGTMPQPRYRTNEGDLQKKWMPRS